MIIVRFMHTFLWWLLVIILYLIITSVILLFSLFSKKPEVLFFKAARLWARICLFFSFNKLTASGLENTPASGPLIIASNHQSLMDIFILLATVPRPFRFVVKKELFKIPFLSWYMKRAGYLSIDRQSAMKAHHTLDAIGALLEQGEAVLIFPEGTRSPDGILKEFKRGGFDLALKSGSPILPVAISGSYKIVPKGGILLHPVPVNMKVGAVIRVPKNPEPSRIDYDDLIARVHSEIARMQ